MPSSASSRQREQPPGERAEEVFASHDAGHATSVDDRDDQHPVMQEDLGELGVREVLADVDVLRVDVPADGFVDAGRALLERRVERPRDEPGVPERAGSSGKSAPVNSRSPKIPHSLPAASTTGSAGTSASISSVTAAPRRASSRSSRTSRRTVLAILCGLIRSSFITGSARPYSRSPAASTRSSRALRPSGTS